MLHESTIIICRLFLIFFLVAITGQVAGQEIQFAESVHDIGRLKAGEVIKYSFAFTNTGDSLLVVSNVQTSCGCTTPGRWTKRVKPGSAGVIPLQVNTSHVGGPMNISIRVTSNDRKQPLVELKLLGKVWERIDANPRLALFDLARDPDAGAIRVLDITNNTDQPISLHPPVINVTNFTAEIKTNEPGRDYQLIVRLISPPASGQQQGLITLQTSCKEQPILAISVIAVNSAGFRPSSMNPDTVASDGLTSAGSEGAAAALPDADRFQQLDDSQAAGRFHDQRYAQHRIVFIDARNDQDYQAGHVPGAWQLDPYHPQKFLAAVLPVCRAAEQVVVYCQGAGCDDSRFSAALLRGNGIANQKLFIYAGGMTGWSGQHLPVEVATPKAASPSHRRNDQA